MTDRLRTDVTAAKPTGLDRPLAPPARCPHAPVVSVMIELEGVRGEHLQRFSCGSCARGWWESDGLPIGPDEAVDRLREVAHGLYKRRTPVGSEHHAARPLLIARVFPLSNFSGDR